MANSGTLFEADDFPDMLKRVKGDLDAEGMQRDSDPGTTVDSDSDDERSDDHIEA